MLNTALLEPCSIEEKRAISPSCEDNTVLPQLEDISFGKSYLGNAVKLAVKKVGLSQQALKNLSAAGVLEAATINDIDRHDEGIEEAIQNLKQSRSFMFATTYILDAASPAAFRLFSAIAERQKLLPNFHCYIAYNSISSSSSKSIAKLAAITGAKISFAKHNNGLWRDSLHQKFFIFDNERAMIGGDNIDNPVESDLMLTVSGSIVASFVEEALDVWKCCDRYFYAPGQSQASLEQKLAEARPIDSAMNGTPMMLLGKDGIKLCGDYYHNPADAGLFAAVDNAVKYINIITPNLNDAVLMQKICAAAERGVHVRVILPKNYMKFLSWLDRAGNYLVLMHRAHLTKEAKNRLEIKWYSNDGRNLCDNHTKYYSFDGVMAQTGSLNGDNQSLSFSKELMLAIEDPAATKMLDQRVFEEAWQTSLPSRETLMHSLLHLPGSTFTRRIATGIYLPLAALRYAWNRATNLISEPLQQSKMQKQLRD